MPTGMGPPSGRFGRRWLGHQASVWAALGKAKIRDERKKQSFDYLRRALTSYRKKPEKYDE